MQKTIQNFKKNQISVIDTQIDINSFHLSQILLLITLSKSPFVKI